MGKERPGKTKVAKRDPAKDKGQCFPCGQDGDWKRNCKDYLEDKVKQKLKEASGIFMTSLHLSDFHDNTWVLDTRSAYHIYNSLQVLARPRRLARGQMDLKMGNGARVAAVTVGENSKRGLIPMRHGISLSRSMSPKTPEERADMDKISYALAIGSIMYVMLCTRPDIAHALSVTSRYQPYLGLEHWKAIKCILKYLRNTKDLLQIYGEGSFQVEGYTDSSFQSDIDDSKLNSWFIFTLNGGVVSWKSSMHDTTADSTIEAEYIAAAKAAKGFG
ncbi:hypothetical protein OPV22_032297 [Ensete ventricosum]|uniref:CCHC-type domain-containing protein n=1 Tax=Ensete ventricosum TaxID=4639 RepID=A0AAV8NZZ7_ENSVE|nr:hypothetical protein OPV22_032297 [Ensete ventricosum]